MKGESGRLGLESLEERRRAFIRRLVIEKSERTILLSFIYGPSRRVFVGEPTVSELIPNVSELVILGWKCVGSVQ